MTRTEERLADALGAAARTVGDDTLNPLTAPERRRRPRHAWAVPVAAATALLLAIGLGAAVSGHFSETGHAARPVATPGGPPPPYYVESNMQTNMTTEVRATATGAVTATVPEIAYDEGLSADADGEFFALGSRSPEDDLMLYRFGLTSAGQVTGLSAVPGGAFPYGDRYGVSVDTVAASPDGSQFAVAVQTDSSTQITVINTATGARSVWQGGIARPGSSFGVISLSWTSNGELVFLAHRCSTPPNGQGCPNAYTPVGGATPSDFQVWELDPEPVGDGLHSGRMLLSGSARYPAIVQALISPDGSTLTALVANQRASTLSAGAPAKPGRFSVDQISVATGAQLSTLYQGSFGPFSALDLTLSSDGPGDHWLINGYGATPSVDGNINGWISGGKLTALKPTVGVYREAWSAPPPAVTPAPVTSHTPAQTAPATTSPYYVETDATGQVVVRSTATGTVIANVTRTLPPSPVGPLVSASGNGTYFVALTVPGKGPFVYRFRLTSSGQVTGLTALPGGVIGTAGEAPIAIAASPNGSQVAVALSPAPYPGCDYGNEPAIGPDCDAAETGIGRADHIVVVTTATGARSVWAGGMPNSLYIPSLSWTGNGSELVFLGQTCRPGEAWYWGETGCMSSTEGETFGVRALNPAQGGGSLDSGRLLLRQSSASENVTQALISADGSTITAALVTGPQGEPDKAPTHGQVTLSVVQISVATGKAQSVLYRKVVAVLVIDGNNQPDGYWHGLLASEVPVLSPGPTGQYWLLGPTPMCPLPCQAQPTGWTGGGRLYELPVGNRLLASDAW